jgi:hypothetical protein
MGHLDGAVGHGVGRLQRRHDFTGREDLDLELAVGQLGDHFRHDFGAGVDRVEGLREARRQAPFDFRIRLGDGRHGDGGRSGAGRGGLDKLTTLHLGTLLGCLAGAGVSKQLLPPGVRNRVVANGFSKREGFHRRFLRLSASFRPHLGALLRRWLKRA